MKIEDLLIILKACKEKTNHEDTHKEADKALLDYIGDKEIKEAFDNIKKWYSWGLLEMTDIQTGLLFIFGITGIIVFGGLIDNYIKLKYKKKNKTKLQRRSGE